MRSLFKLSLAALIACAFAGSAMAVDIKMSGNIGTAFGLASFGESVSSATATTVSAPKGVATSTATTTVTTVDAHSAYATSYEANLRTTIGGGPLTQVFRFRPRGSNSDGAAGDWNVADLYAETYWKPIDELTILFGRQQGGAWSSPLAGAYLIHNAIGVTHQEYWLNWTGADGLDIEYNLGTMQIGLGLTSECRPFCGTTAIGAQAANVNSAQSMTPHFQGKFGDIAVRAQLPSTSGKRTATADAVAVATTSTGSTTKTTSTKTDNTYGGSGMQAGVSWSGAGLLVAADIQNFTDKESGGSGSEDYTKSATNIRVDVVGITLSLWNGTNTNMGGVKDNNNTISTLLVRYTLKVGDGAVYPEYGSITTTPEEGDAVTNTLLRIVGNMAF
jgi:hypothetical protein